MTTKNILFRASVIGLLIAVCVGLASPVLYNKTDELGLKLLSNFEVAVYAIAIALDFILSIVLQLIFGSLLVLMLFQKYRISLLSFIGIIVITILVGFSSYIVKCPKCITMNKGALSDYTTILILLESGLFLFINIFVLILDKKG